MSEPELRENKTLPETEEELPFVPYAAEAEAEESVGRKKKIILLIPLAVALICVIIVAVMSTMRKNNFYQDALSSLSFDYRQGETVKSDPESGLSFDHAERLAESLKNKAVDITAYSYYLDEKNAISEDIAEYRLTHNGEGDTAQITFCTANAISSETEEIRRTSSGVLVRDGSSWKEVSDISLPQLYEYCFSVKSNSKHEISKNKCFTTSVGNILYDCEIWLMHVGSNYYTLYRYYTGNTLRAVRVLNSSDNLTWVYDIKAYSSS